MCNLKNNQLFEGYVYLNSSQDEIAKSVGGDSAVMALHAAKDLKNGKSVGNVISKT